MGKYIFGGLVVLVILGGVFILGFTAGITTNGGRVCQMDEDGQTHETVCIVDGVTYTPEDPDE